MGKRIVLADPRGFCAGVDRAILTVRTILKSADTPRATDCRRCMCAARSCTTSMSSRIGRAGRGVRAGIG